ncbi:MAG: porin [Chromatiales bacterium]
MLKNKLTLPMQGAALCVSAILAAPAVQSANWLMLQGTENPKAPKHRMFGFIQPSYTHNVADPMTGLSGPLVANNGKVVAQNLISPKFDDQTGFHVRRARLGFRGKLTDEINYFTLFEVAPNLLTYDAFGDRARDIALDHVSLTFNQIPGARVRLGLFKNPGSEESYQAIHVFDYIEFTDFTAREVLERFVTGVRSPAASAQGNIGTITSTAYGFNGVRDWGIQVFDHVKKDNWDFSYAVKVGRGEDIQSSDDNNFNPELYLYGSAEYDLPGGKGARKNGVKLYAWRQQGKRDFETDPLEREYDRVRQGIGFKALGNLFGSSYKHRLSGELMFAEGVIFLAPAGNVPGGALQYAVDDDNKARGFYLDYGFYLDNHWQFDVRYDQNNLLYETAADVDPGNEREIRAWTFGVNYHFTPKLRLTANYIKREAEAPVAYANAALTADVRTTVSNLDDRLAVQLTWLF